MLCVAFLIRSTFRRSDHLTKPGVCQALYWGIFSVGERINNLRGEQGMAEDQKTLFHEITDHSPLSLRRQAAKARLNPSTFTNISLGMRPSLETALRIADSLIPAEDPELRARWFQSVGHEDPRASRGELIYEALFDPNPLAAF